MDVTGDVSIFEIAVFDACAHEDLPVDLVDPLLILLNDRVHKLGLAVLEELLVLSLSGRFGQERLAQIASTLLDAHVIWEIIQGKAETFLVAGTCGLYLRTFCWV